MKISFLWKEEPPCPSYRGREKTHPNPPIKGGNMKAVE